MALAERPHGAGTPTAKSLTVVTVHRSLHSNKAPTKTGRGFKMVDDTGFALPVLSAVADSTDGPGSPLKREQRSRLARSVSTRFQPFKSQYRDPSFE